MSELDIATIRTRSLRGIVALIQQSFIIQLSGIISFGFLAALLKTNEIGLFGVVNSIIAFLTYFSDVGLAGALIQKKERLTEEDLVTTFTVQQILAVVILVVGLSLTGLFQSFYHLDTTGVYLFWALIISFFLSSFKTIPAILLERKLEFHKIVIPQILETLTFNILVVILAYKGLGIMSFAIAALLRSVIGLVAIYVLSPWVPKLGFSKSVLHRLFRFGIPYQSISFLALMKDDLLFLFLGKLLPLDAMGYIYVAKKFAELPLRTVMDNVMRVTFPAYSRLQHDSKILVKAIENTLFGINLILLPIYAALFFFIEPLFRLIPKYHKWEPAIFTIYCIIITSLAASFATPLTNAMSAIGKIKITLVFMVLWTSLTWVLILLFVPMFGYNGFGLTLAGVASTAILVIIITKRAIPFSVMKSFKVPVMAVIPQLFFYFLFVPRISITWLNVIIVGSIGVLFYATIIFLLAKEKIAFLFQSVRGR